MMVVRTSLFLLLVISLPFFVVDLGKPAFTDGEAVYSEIPRAMRESGDWITPRISGIPHFDKPPLLYWLVGLSQGLLGETETAARLWPALASWATIFVVGATGALLYGTRAGWLSALVFASSIGPYIFSRLVRPEPVLCFLIALAILSYAKGFMGGNDRNRHWLWVMFVSLGLAGLAKGLLGLGLPTAIIGLHAALSGRLKGFLSWQTAAGIGLVAAIVLPWHVSLARANPDFLSYHVIHENLLRFTGQRTIQDEFLSAPVFLAFTLLWTYPWMALLPQALAGAIGRLKSARWREERDLLPLLWIFVVVGLFTASRSRLEYYALPALPALALVLGKMWDEMFRRSAQASSRPMVVALGVTSAILGLSAAAAYDILGPSHSMLLQFLANSWPDSGWTGLSDQLAILLRIRLPTVLVLTGSAIFTLGAALALKASRPGLACGLLAGMMAPIFILVHWGFLVMEPFQSSQPAAEALNRLAPVDVMVCQEPREYIWLAGITFYTRGTLYVLKDPRFDEANVRRRKPVEKFLSQEELSRLWQSGKRVALVLEETDENAAARLSQLGPGRVVGRFGTRVVVATGLTTDH